MDSQNENLTRAMKWKIIGKTVGTFILLGLTVVASFVSNLQFEVVLENIGKYLNFVGSSDRSYIIALLFLHLIFIEIAFLTAIIGLYGFINLKPKCLTPYLYFINGWVAAAFTLTYFFLFYQLSDDSMLILLCIYGFEHYTAETLTRLALASRFLSLFAICLSTLFSTVIKSYVDMLESFTTPTWLLTVLRFSFVQQQRTQLTFSDQADGGEATLPLSVDQQQRIMEIIRT